MKLPYVLFLMVIRWLWLFSLGKLTWHMVWHMQVIHYLKMITLHLAVPRQADPFIAR